MPPTVYLFDIDGTLLESGGAGRRAMEGAFEAVIGSPALASVGFAGMTDRAIVRAGLDPELPEVEVTIDAVIEAYLRRLPVEIARSETYRLHVGARARVEQATARANAAVGLGTGNVERGAQLKLAPLGIAQHFEFGGFGSDDEDRAALLEIGARRGAARLGRDRAACRVMVIGDTPRDVAAGHAIGAEVLAVATGLYDQEALADCGPAWVVPDLEEPAAVAALFAPGTSMA